MSPLGPCASLSPCAPYVLLCLHVPFLCHYAPNVPPMCPNASTRPHVSPLCSSYPYAHSMYLYISQYSLLCPPYYTYVPTYFSYIPYVSSMLSITLCSLIQLMPPYSPWKFSQNTKWPFYRHGCD